MTKQRSGLAIILVLSIELMATASPAPGTSRKDKFWEKADVSAVVKAVRRQRSAPSELECEQLIRLNFKHLYFNALDTGRFIAMPKPDKVLERMSRVFSQAAELRAALDEARLLSDEGGEQTGLRRSAAKKIRDCAAGIHDSFHDFFKEDTIGSFDVELPVNSEARARFAEYLATCERISSLLDQELERYFLNPSPGIVEVSTFRSCSIPVLSLCLERVSLNFEKSLLE